MERYKGILCRGFILKTVLSQGGGWRIRDGHIPPRLWLSPIVTSSVAVLMYMTTPYVKILNALLKSCTCRWLESAMLIKTCRLPALSLSCQFDLSVRSGLELQKILFVTGRHMNVLTIATNYVNLFMEAGLCLYPFLHFSYFTCVSRLWL